MRFFVGVVIIAVITAPVATFAREAGTGLVAAASRTSLKRLVTSVSLEHGLDPRLMDALVRAESDYDPQAVSHKGAMGLMQLMPATARRLAVDDPFDPEKNIRGGVREFSRLVDRFDGSVPLALAAYNAGEGAVDRFGGVPPYRETRQYVDRIMRMYTGKPYSSVAVKRAAPVRLVREGATGKVVITNVGRTTQVTPVVGVTRSLAADRSGSKLSGGFGR